MASARTPMVSSAKVVLNSSPPEGWIEPASCCSEPAALATKRVPVLSKGLGNAMFTVAPIELLESVTSGVFKTLRDPTKSAPTVLKSTERPPAAVEIRRPSYSVSLKSPPKPRTVMPSGSPRVPARWIDTPGTRCSEAATFESGNLPMSSEVITSTTPDACRFMSRLRCRDPMRPVTTISSRSSGLELPGGAVCAAAGNAIDSANNPEELASARFSFLLRIWNPLRVVAPMAGSGSHAVVRSAALPGGDGCRSCVRPRCPADTPRVSAGQPPAYTYRAIPILDRVPVASRTRQRAKHMRIDVYPYKSRFHSSNFDHEPAGARRIAPR